MDGASVFQANRFLWEENQRLRKENQDLQEDLNRYRWNKQRLHELETQSARLLRENARLSRRVAQLTEKLSAKPKPAAPPFVKPNVESQRRKRPGRKAGHAPALRRKPGKIDEHRQVDFPVDAQGQASCPDCHAQLSDIQHHQHVVEDMIPARLITTCFHTTSGYCPQCRKRMETRAEDQPPPADLPHAQLGLNALTTAAVLRVSYRMPLRQISRLFEQSGVPISPAGIVKQLRRLSKWLLTQYHRLKLHLRASPVVYADETGWRTNGRNTQLWTVTNGKQTLYHVDKSRGAKVIAELLGESFGTDGRSTLVSDFYSVYDQFDCAQQKCLAHLLRELSDTVSEQPKLAGHAFFKRCRRLIREMLRLKSRREQLDPEVYRHQVGLLEKRLKELSRQYWRNAQAQRLARRLRRSDGKLTTFLHRAEVEGTNNAAERALRPAVVMRKITGGSRSEESARAWAVLASVMRTAEQQGRELTETIKMLLKSHWAGEDVGALADLLTHVAIKGSRGR